VGRGRGRRIVQNRYTFKRDSLLHGSTLCAMPPVEEGTRLIGERVK
jgi:hypothetical protein